MRIREHGADTDITLMFVRGQYHLITVASWYVHQALLDIKLIWNYTLALRREHLPPTNQKIQQLNGKGLACVEDDDLQSLTDISLSLLSLTFQFPLWSRQSTPPRGGRATERWQSPTLTLSSGPTVTAAWTCQTGWQCPTPRGLTLSQCRCVCVCMCDRWG